MKWALKTMKKKKTWNGIDCSDIHYIGIDYSYTSPAICILKNNFKDSQFYYANYNKVLNNTPNIVGYKLDSVLKETERYDEIARWAYNIIKPFKDTCIVGLEGYSFGSSKSLVFNIAENVGILKFYLFTLGIKPIIISPTTNKKFFSGSGRSNKEDMRQALIQREGVDIVDYMQLKTLKSPAHDIVDSYALSLCVKGI